METKVIIDRLNAPSSEERLAAVAELKKLEDAGILLVPAREGYTNNHVHTMYSFSPYSPAKAVWMAYKSGLATVGIVDHDAVGGAEEFARAGALLGIAVTEGFEIRTDWTDTLMEGRRVNNPDQVCSAYICAHGIPRNRIREADAFLSRIRAARGLRNRQMVARLNALMREYGISLDYDADVLPISYAQYGGEVTERHLMMALGLALIRSFGKGRRLISLIADDLQIPLSKQQITYLTDEENDAYVFELINILKSHFIGRIYVDAQVEEMPPVREAVEFIRGIGAIPTYCYLGDVGASPTGDKKAQKFEDEYLEELLAACKDIGFQAVAIMPSRNTREQLMRVMRLCDELGFMQISGEDINQPRQSFICTQLKGPELHPFDRCHLGAGGARD